MISIKKIISTLLTAVLLLGMIQGTVFADTADADEPLITIGTISDPHTDYNLQKKKPYIRKSYVTALEALKKEGIDLLMVGGDITSDNQDNGGNLRWEPDVYDRTVLEYQKISSAASTTGKTLWACGNHDSEVGCLSDSVSYSSGDYNSYQGFVDMMLTTCGDPVDFYVQAQDPAASSGALYTDHLMGAHYNINGFDFIVINPPYGHSLYYTDGTLSWLDSTLEKIGADKTVFITGHYPLTDNRGISTPTYGISDANYTKFVNVMNKYDNAIYLYGHNHGGAESVYISSDTFERITHYDSNGKVINDRDTAPTSFITAFMGSASYYKYSLNPDWLGAADPYIVQAMTIKVYKDRIEFKMINCGQKFGDSREPAVWTVAREVKFSGTINDTTSSILVTNDVNESVLYDSSLGINKYKIPEGSASITAANHVIEAEGVAGEELSLTVKRVFFGSKFDTTMKKLSKVVNDAVIFDYVVKDGNKKINPESPIKVTLPAPIAEFGDNTKDVDLAAYYWNNDGKLCMTDVVINDDGTCSFIMTNLSTYALSARSNVKDSAPAVEEEKDNDRRNNDMTVIIIITAVVVAVAVIVTVVVLLKKKAKNKAE